MFKYYLVANVSYYFVCLNFFFFLDKKRELIYFCYQIKELHVLLSTIISTRLYLRFTKDMPEVH